MHISYKPLWHTLLERDMRKEDLRLAAGMTTCRWYDNEYDCQHEQRGKAHQHGYISPYLRNAEL